MHIRHNSWFVSVDEDGNHNDENVYFILLQSEVK